MTFPWREALPGDFAVVGSPVAHSLSPAMHQAAYRALGLDLVYRAVEVSPGELAAAAGHLADLGYRGLNVTLPLKEEAYALFGCEDPRPEAANTLDLAGRQAWNTDVPALAGELADVAPGRALVLGGGGGARAAIVALADLGFEILCWARRPEAVSAWAQRHAIPVRTTPAPDPAGCSVVVNATSAGHSGAALPVDFGLAHQECLAYDLSYGDAARPFLEAASAEGLRVRDGLGMLVGQGARSLTLWLGVEAPTAAMREAAGCP
jgi:shikimate dehydrogenase